MTGAKPKPGRLGRGLAALIGEDETFGHLAVTQVATHALEPSRFQPRREIDPAALEELTASVRSHGILQPLLVRPGNVARCFEIVAGERRWRAAQAAGLAEIPVLVRDLDDRTALGAALIENLQRQDLNAIEEAEGLRRLASEYGMTQDSLAASVGKSRSHVANMMRLLSLPEAVKNDVRRGALTAGHARALINHPDPARAALNIVARGLSVRQAEALARPAEPRRRAVTADEAIETRDLAHRLMERLGVRVAIRHHHGKGTLELGYDSLDQLEGLIRLLDPTSAG